MRERWGKVGAARVRAARATRQRHRHASNVSDGQRRTHAAALQSTVAGAHSLKLDLDGARARRPRDDSAACSLLSLVGREIATSTRSERPTRIARLQCLLALWGPRLACWWCCVACGRVDARLSERARTAARCPSSSGLSYLLTACLGLCRRACRVCAADSCTLRETPRTNRLLTTPAAEKWIGCLNKLCDPSPRTWTTVGRMPAPGDDGQRRPRKRATERKPRAALTTCSQTVRKTKPSLARSRAAV